MLPVLGELLQPFPEGIKASPGASGGSVGLPGGLIVGTLQEYVYIGGGIGGHAYQPVGAVNGNFEYYANQKKFDNFFKILAVSAVKTSVELTTGYIKPTDAKINTEVNSSIYLDDTINSLFRAVNSAFTSWKSNPEGYAASLFNAFSNYAYEVDTLAKFMTQGNAFAFMWAVNLSFTDSKTPPSGLIFGTPTVPVIYNITTSANAEYYASAGNDILLVGSASNRTVDAGRGDDLVVLKASEMTVQDGPGNDAYVFLYDDGEIIFSGDRNVYSVVELAADTLQLTHLATGDVDIVVGAQTFYFDDGLVYRVDPETPSPGPMQPGGMSTLLSDDQVKEIAKLYIAYFNRAPEYDGLRYHIAKVEDRLREGVSFEQALNERADTFFASAITMPEATGYTAWMSSADFVKVIYENVQLRPGYGGPAPTDSEIDYWIRRLEDRSPDGPVTRGGMVLEFLDAIPFLLEYGTPYEKQIVAQVDAVLQNRIIVGLEFAKEEISGTLFGEAATLAGKAALVGVSSDPASVEIAIDWVHTFSPHALNYYLSPQSDDVTYVSVAMYDVISVSDDITFVGVAADFVDYIQI